ncbi:MAG: phage tail tape measure protein [Methylotenera sp.]|nr:phage tail tape measure protein [Methylotenera sp.]
MSVNVEVKLKLSDGASRGITKAAELQQKALRQSENLTVQSNNRQRSSYEKLSQAREVLGVRGERTVQREIQHTEAAYKRLAASGALSAKELNRAYDAQLKKVRELKGELGAVNKLQTAMTVGAALAAGGYVIKSAASKAMSFDERLASMSNTAFAERDLAGRKVGMKQLEAVINHSTQRGIGGGTREQAAEALDAMIAKGILGYQGSVDFLPTIMKTATGASAAPVDIANLASVLKGQGIVSNDKELRTALNMITASGQAGGFEIKDQAKWLAQQLPLAGKSGLMGLNGLQKVLTMNQAAILTSGTTDEAGNNVKNLLAKLSSKDTAADFDKTGRGDLGKYLMDQRVKGVDAVTAWMNIIDKEAANNPQMKAVMAKLKVSKDKTEQKELIDSLNALAEGGVVGKYFQDMQAVSALMGLRNKDVTDQVDATISKNRTEYGVNDVNYALMSSTASAQVRAAEQAKDAGTKAAMDSLTPTIATLSGQFADLATKHPALAGAATLATTALIAMAGAAGLATMATGGKGAAAGAIGRTATRYLPKAGKLAGRAGVLGVGSAVGGAGLDYAFGEESAISRYGSSALNGAATGALVGSLIPVVGTAVGAAVGGSLGLLTEYLTSPSNKEPAKVETTVRVQLADGLKASSQTTNTSGPVKNFSQTGSVWGIP